MWLRGGYTGVGQACKPDQKIATDKFWICRRRSKPKGGTLIFNLKTAGPLTAGAGDLKDKSGRAAKTMRGKLMTYIRHYNFFFEGRSGGPFLSAEPLGHEE